MCGRFAQPRSSEELARIFGASDAAALPGQQFNVAPTDQVAAVVELLLPITRWADGVAVDA